MKRLFLDANVLFSAAHKDDSAQGLLIAFAERRLIAAITSAYAMAEAERNLALKSPGSVRALMRIRAVCKLTPVLAPNADADLLAWARGVVVEKDAPILAAAVHAEANWLVTGDRRDFGHLFLTVQRGVLVIPPAEAVRRLVDELDA